MDWAVNPDQATPRFFWLDGIAGIGKTTVACTIANLLQNSGLLGAQFCFSRLGKAELRDPALVFPTIAYQLARFDPEFSSRITKALVEDPQAPFRALKQQLQCLIVNPLSKLERDPKRIVILVLDAFDECETRGAKEILQLLVATMPNLPFFLKIFVTSRPEKHIRSVLIPSDRIQITAVHDISVSVARSDILLYLKHQRQRIAEENGLPADWIKDIEIELLADAAGILFVYVTTAMKFLSNAFNPTRELKVLLPIISSSNLHTTTAKPFLKLDELYEQILCDLLSEENADSRAEQLRLVLGSITLLRDPLPVAALERLVSCEPGEVSGVLNHLFSVVLTPPPPGNCPQAHHPSFPDFLRDHTRCTDDRLWINSEEHEGRMALRCLELLNTSLHKEMLGSLDPASLNSEVDDLKAKVDTAVVHEAQYACRHWPSHLQNTSHTNTKVKTALSTFASSTILPWIEGMSWLGELDLAIKGLQAAKTWEVRR